MSETGIGARVQRVEDRRFITGKGRYTDDINRPRQTYAYFLRSPHAHARITAIDTAAATLVLRGLVIRYANARFEDGTRDQLRVGVKIDVKGRLASDGTSLDAVEIEFED